MPLDHLSADDEFELEAAIYRHDSLNKWLSYEGYQPLLWGGGFFLPIGLVAVVATAAAIVFVPFMIRDLVYIERKGWIVGWVVFVAIPSTLVFLLVTSEQRLLITTYVFLPTSYIFFWALKLAVDTWVVQLTARLEFLVGSKLSAQAARIEQFWRTRS